MFMMSQLWLNTVKDFNSTHMLGFFSFAFKEMTNEVLDPKVISECEKLFKVSLHGNSFPFLIQFMSFICELWLGLDISLISKETEQNRRKGWSTVGTFEKKKTSVNALAFLARSLVWISWACFSLCFFSRQNAVWKNWNQI